MVWGLGWFVLCARQVVVCQVSRFSGWFGAVPKPIDYYQMLVTFASKVNTLPCLRLAFASNFNPFSFITGVPL